MHLKSAKMTTFRLEAIFPLISLLDVETDSFGQNPFCTICTYVGWLFEIFMLNRPISHEIRCYFSSFIYFAAVCAGKRTTERTKDKWHGKEKLKNYMAFNKWACLDIFRKGKFVWCKCRKSTWCLSVVRTVVAPILPLWAWCLALWSRLFVITSYEIESNTSYWNVDFNTEITLWTLTWITWRWNTRALNTSCNWLKRRK